MTLRLRFGALSPPLKAQLIGQAKLRPDELRICQEAADAISDLHVTGMLTTGEAKRARQRLFKRICKSAIPATKQRGLDRDRFGR